jgi:hypothetical protein
MKKTDKTLENTIVKALTEVCEQSLKEVNGFQWLTHLVNYKDFPRSLTVICIFDTKDQVSRLLKSQQYEALVKLIVETLKGSGIQLPNSHKQIKLDSEEACLGEHAGNWKRRLK